MRTIIMAAAVRGVAAATPSPPTSPPSTSRDIMVSAGGIDTVRRGITG